MRKGIGIRGAPQYQRGLVDTASRPPPHLHMDIVIGPAASPSPEGASASQTHLDPSPASIEAGHCSSVLFLSIQDYV